MIALDDGRRARRTSSPAPATRAARWLATALVGLVLIGWVASLYVLVLVADGLSQTNSHTDWWAHVIAVALIAITIEPVRRWLRLTIDDVVYGHPDDVYAVMTELNRQIDVTTPSGEPGAGSLAGMIARSLNVPYVAIVDGDTETSVVGVRPADRDLADVPLMYQGAEIGHLYVAPRHARTTLSNRDLTLLAELGQQLAVALFAIRASEQVQASRAALVTAREEERRRIRRDLHDGLGPTLASMKLQLTAVARLLDTEPVRAAHLLEEVREGMDATTADIRRLVYGLRPPLIDELGLIAALRNHPAAQAGLAVTVQPDQLPDLPAAVEVALYRIASEAIHNAGRHSGGRRCEVSIDVSADEVCLRVTDDGRGLPEPLVKGVGLSAMRERAAELGGAVELTSKRRYHDHYPRTTTTVGCGMTEDVLRVLIADDHALFRRGVRSLLSTVPGVEVVGEAGDGASAIALTGELAPDLVLMDLQMPGGGGLAAIRAVTEQSPAANVLVVTMFEDDDSVFAAMRAGARGYVLKDMDADDFARAIIAVGRGEALFSRGIATRMMRFFSEPRPAARLFPDLTDSERGVLRLMATGANNAAIARELSLSSKTVRNYISNIFRKLQVADRSQAIVVAREAGLEKS